jgi:hypothetical protein
MGFPQAHDRAVAVALGDIAQRLIQGDQASFVDLVGVVILVRGRDRGG